MDELADALPVDIYRELNGGVNLLPFVKRRSEEDLSGLYILGDYNRDNLGRYINIYYGSFEALYGNAPPEVQRKQLEGVLHHELLHHLEALAGERGLAIKDEIDLLEYRRMLYGGDERRVKLKRKRRA